MEKGILRMGGWVLLRLLARLVSDISGLKHDQWLTRLSLPTLQSDILTSFNIFRG